MTPKEEKKKTLRATRSIKKKKVAAGKTSKQRKKVAPKKSTRTQTQKVFDIPVVRQEMSGSVILAHVEPDPLEAPSFASPHFISQKQCDPLARFHSRLNTFVLVSCTTVYVLAFVFAGYATFAAPQPATPPSLQPPTSSPIPGVDATEGVTSDDGMSITNPNVTLEESTDILNQLLQAYKDALEHAQRLLEEKIRAYNTWQALQRAADNPDATDAIKEQARKAKVDHDTIAAVFDAAYKDVEEKKAAYEQALAQANAPAQPVSPPTVPTDSSGGTSGGGVGGSANASKPAGGGGISTVGSGPSSLRALLQQAAQVAYGTATPLSIGVIVAGILQVLFGLLGVVFAVLLFYGGFVWMTAQGDEEKTKKSLNLIQQSVIGLIITLASSSASYFILNAMLKAVQK